VQQASKEHALVLGCCYAIVLGCCYHISPISLLLIFSGVFRLGEAEAVEVIGHEERVTRLAKARQRLQLRERPRRSYGD
jgi:hypothetical protein